MQRNTKYEKKIIQQLKYLPEENQSLILNLIKVYSLPTGTVKKQLILENIIGKLQARSTFKKIKNPVDWQRKLRSEW